VLVDPDAAEAQRGVGERRGVAGGLGGGGLGPETYARLGQLPCLEEVGAAARRSHARSIGPSGRWAIGEIPQRGGVVQPVGTAAARAKGMTIVEASIRRASATQSDRIERAEHACLSPALARALGVSVGRQLRIVRGDDHALFTVSELRADDDGNVVRLGLGGRRRLGTDDGFDGTVDPLAARSELGDDDAAARGELVERLCDRPGRVGLIAIAPHGGDIEPATDRQAEHVACVLAGRGASVWRCKGWKPGGGAHQRWHITATDIDPRSFPLLAAVADRGFRDAVAFHGSDGGDGTDVLIGGAARRSLKRSLRAAILAATDGSGLVVRIAGPGDDLGGDDPRNLVNRLPASGVDGVQVEQSPAARQHHWLAIADAVADVYRRRHPSDQATGGGRR
jgi:phage replication-related protein YjqB (UPF0714/DUF867 family)